MGLDLRLGPLVYSVRYVLLNITMEGARMQQSLVDVVKQAAVERDGRLVLACAAAFRIAEETGAALSEIGRACNQERIKIIGCQLGCFP